jgi:hypothetical protein
MSLTRSRVRLLLPTVASLFLSLITRTVTADDEASNRTVVRSSEHGSVYARSIPEESYGSKCKTKIFHVGAEQDALIAEYPWYSSVLYLGGEGEDTVVRFGPWQRGRQPEASHLAIGIYRKGKTIREYSTLQMQQLGSGSSSSVSHYTVFNNSRPRFRWVKDNVYVLEAQGESGKMFTFSLKTGQITSAP